MGFAEVLTLLFVLLKLTHVIDWSWWWVMAPEIVAFAFYIFFALGFFVTFFEVAKTVKKASRR